MEQHCDGKPTVDRDKCKACRQCIKQCAHGAISYDEKKIASINHDLCVGCGRRITSYNVCYTKLLRHDDVDPAHRDAEAGGLLEGHHLGHLPALRSYNFV